MKENSVVYSTETGRIKADAPSKAMPSGDGIARIRRETKGRKGKGVTTISGILLAETELKVLCAELKKLCGTGGTLKDNVIEIQGDHRDKIKAALEKKGLQVKLAGG